jgi:hypothetical protein
MELLQELAAVDCLDALTRVGDTARTAEGRAELTDDAQGESLLKRLAELLGDQNVLVVTKCVRAVGNLVIDHETNRTRAVELGIVRDMVGFGRITTDTRLLTVVCGALTNLSCDSPSTQAAVVQAGEPLNPSLPPFLPTFMGIVAISFAFVLCTIRGTVQPPSRVLISAGGVEMLVRALDLGCDEDDEDALLLFGLRALGRTLH